MKPSQRTTVVAAAICVAVWKFGVTFNDLQGGYGGSSTNTLTTSLRVLSPAKRLSSTAE